MKSIGAVLILVVPMISACGSGGGGSGNPCAADPSKCACSSDGTCADPTPRCNVASGTCVPCLPSPDNCPAGQHCVASGNGFACVPQSSCTAAIDCPRSGNLPGLCCAGKCADPLNDISHCGTCGNLCGDVPNGKGGCVSGACGVLSCNDGFGDCDKKGQNGCEVDVTTDLNHCGGCGMPCKAAPNSKTACVAGKCTSECGTDFADCDGNAANGCETSLTTNPSHCGACGRMCGSLPNAAGVACVASACVVAACKPGFFDCNKSAPDGCESDIQNDPNNCSGCGKKCPGVQNGAAGCNAGNCGIGKCNPGFDDCDRNVLNGCEQDLSSDPKNCGACGVTCNVANGVAACQAGKCVLQACSPNWLDCDGNAQNGCEVNLLIDVANCGACGNACPVPQNATATCSAGVCGIGSCKYGWADCNKNINDGCETSVLTVKDCGACGNACPALQNAVVSCPQAACAVGSCNLGFADCDMKPANGCEVAITSDPNNCGGCGMMCAPGKNQLASCVAGKCGFGACAQGFADCNKNPADGCEADVSADPLNCGACGKQCMNPTPRCAAGMCSAMPVYVGTFNVSGGPAWGGNPPCYTCMEACALLFGGQAAQYACSTQQGMLDRKANTSVWGVGGCMIVAEDFKKGVNYNCGSANCAQSAYVSDNCAPGPNYCFK